MNNVGNTLFKYRLFLGGFMLGTFLSGATAFPLTAELNFLADFLVPHRETFPSFVDWIQKVRVALVETDAKYPFLAYGFDWLAFAHLMIAALFVGPFREPTKHRYILGWGMFCCVATVPLALICGPIRGIPWGWTIIDLCFGALAFPVLWACYRWSLELQKSAKQS